MRIANEESRKRARGSESQFPGLLSNNLGNRKILSRFIALTVLLVHGLFPAAWPQSSGSGSITGRVQDAAGLVVAGAPVAIRNVLTGYEHSTSTDTGGEFHLFNVPLGRYEVNIHASGFQAVQQTAEVKSPLPIRLDIQLKLPVAEEKIGVQAQISLIDNSPGPRSELDQNLLDRLPIVSSASSFSSILTLATPGLQADSNGQIDPVAEEGDTTIVVDNEIFGDRQGRNFTSQLSPEVIQSIQVIQGVPPAEFGDKEGLVVLTQTRSGLGLSQLEGSVTGGYGSFGTQTGTATLGFGSRRIGNFIAVDGLETGRFLDTPEFLPAHGRGNAGNVFDAVDLQPTSKDAFQLNLGAARSWFQVPNTYDQAAVGQDQRQQLRSFNISPGFSHLFSSSTLVSTNAWVRQQRVDYYPSEDLFSDQPVTLSQSRGMTNAGFRGDLSLVDGAHDVKAGFQFQYYALSEAFQLALTDPLFNAVCQDPGGLPVVAPGITSPSDCPSAGYEPNKGFQQGLLPFDLTRGGRFFHFRGRAAIAQEAAYVQDVVKLRDLSIMLGLRADNYDGISQASALQPRLGISYHVVPTQTVLRASYGRLFETPFTDNLIITSSNGAGGLDASANSNPLIPGIRNQFDTGLQQALGRRLVVDADYVWKFTRRAYDSDALLNTPLVFPTQWRKAKTDGVNVRITFPSYRGLSAFSALGHVRARFFGPEIGGLLFTNQQSYAPFRIDQDQAFQQTTHLQYQFGTRGPWLAFTWRYDSGVVNASVPNFATALTLSADEQAAIGLFCGSAVATLNNPIRSCNSPKIGASRLYIPAAGTENDDLNPPRIAPRHLFDLGGGVDNVLHGDRYRLGLRFEVLNLANNVALYNFLSDFSGTHFVQPRTYHFEAALRF